MPACASTLDRTPPTHRPLSYSTATQFTEYPTATQDRPAPISGQPDRHDPFGVPPSISDDPSSTHLFALPVGVQAVAGYDLTFSPVKSVSALWAVADLATAATIERAHRAAVWDGLRFIEQHALYTRTGAKGVRQVDVRGMAAAAFTHRDSRAGDPDLHTHVAVANKVQTLDGRWLSVDGRLLFKATVTASETDNTALENHLRASLGVRFAARPNPDQQLRPSGRSLGSTRS
jgi:TrwC relaxase